MTHGWFATAFGREQVVWRPEQKLDRSTEKNGQDTRWTRKGYRRMDEDTGERTEVGSPEAEAGATLALPLLKLSQT